MSSPLTTHGRGNWRRREEAVSSINGHMIRPVRTGAAMLYTVDGTGQRFTDVEAAEAHASTLEPKHRS